MRAAEILRKLADIIDSADQKNDKDEIGRSIGSDGGDVMDNSTMQRMDPVPEPEQDTGDDGKMVPYPTMSLSSEASFCAVLSPACFLITSSSSVPQSS